ncbi:Stress responsive alpha-beta barrel [Spatholobus suberectus]|nr:Stress responsive alpha-beta barrel [Spatholobus suberectus]
MAFVFLFVSLIDSPKPLYLFTVSQFAPSTLNSFNQFCKSILRSITVSASIRISFPAYHWNRFKSARKNQRITVLCGMGERSSNLGSERKRSLSFIVVTLSSSEFPLLTTTVSISCRKIVEHVCLLKAKQDLSEEEENDMLDYLYTTQYQMGGVVAISLGRVSAPNPARYTHALFMRFQKKENLEKFYTNPFYLKVLKDHVMTYCHGLINVDYESEVADEMLSIFRKGEEFNHGVEFVLLISFNEDALGYPADCALASLALMMLESPSLIVQFTQGLNFSPSSKEYTHGVVIRFRSVEAFEIFTNSKEYKDVWLSKFQPIVHKSLSLHFSVDPVGTEIM